MKSVISILLVLCFVSLSFAGTRQTKVKTENKDLQLVCLSGNVIDQKSGEALVGVEVKLIGTDLVTYTNLDGHFTFTNIKLGEYQISSSYVSYNKTVNNLSIDNNSSQIKIELKALK